MHRPITRSNLSELEGAVRDYLERQFAAPPAQAEAPPLRTEDQAPLPAKQLARLLEISTAMNRIHDREELLGCVRDGLRELFDAENNFLILFDEDDRPQIFASHTDDKGELPVSETILERVRHTREPVLIQDTASRPDLRDKRSIKLYKIASVLCAPLCVGDKVIGVLQFDHRGSPHRFPQSDMRLLALFADHAATALNNLQLIAWLNEALEEAKAAQRRIVQSERLSALGEMAAGIAHDFNNSLFVALGFCDVLLAKDSLEGDVTTALQRIRTCALDAANTVRRLQTFASGKQAESRLASVDLAAVAEEMVEFTRHKWLDEAQRRGISVTLETDLGSSPPVLGSAAEVREVLINLIFNAVDAMQHDGVITLQTGLRGERAYVSVQDEGGGMDPEVMERVFEPFFTTKGARGYGFGLSTCWSIARRLGGEIEVQSTPDEGSLFTLLLPLDRSARDAPSSPPRQGPQVARVLLVDDDPEVLHTVEVLVQIIGHQPVGFTSPEEALASFGVQKYDAVITDFGMPGMSGADVARLVQAKAPELPVIILTGWGTDVQLEEDLTPNVAAVLPKPITMEGLRASLAEVLRHA